MLAGIQRSLSLLELEAWMPSETGAISPTVEQLMRLIEPWRCIVGDESVVELALREALNNAVVHGNGMDPNKLVEIRCRCERGKGVWLIVRDQGRGFDPSTVPNPLTPQGLMAEHGRGIHLIKVLMDKVSFKRGGSEVHMWKGAMRKSRKELPKNNDGVSTDSTSSIELDAATVECE
jgi:serine/threonine-protein kinase RsbW